MTSTELERLTSAVRFFLSGAVDRLPPVLPLNPTPPAHPPSGLDPQTLERVVPGWQFVEWLGHGATGSVFHACHIDTGAHAAIKVLRNPGQLTRFRREEAKLRKLGTLTRHIVGLKETLDSRETLIGDNRFEYIVMDLIDGESLERLLARCKTLLPDTARAIGLQLCEALHLAHANAILHRDLKPSNVMVQHDGTVVIIDLGLAKDAFDARLTSDGVLVGTLGYMAPEVMKGKPATVQSDVYSLGVILWECLTGERPEPHTGTVEEFHELVPPAFDRIMRKALHPDPALRFQSVDELRSALQELELFSNAFSTTGSNDLVQQLQALVDEARQIADGKIRVELLILNWDQQVLEQVAEVGLHARPDQRSRPISKALRAEKARRAGAPTNEVRTLLWDAGICADVAATGREAIVGDVSRDPRYCAVSRDDDTKSEVALPIFIDLAPRRPSSDDQAVLGVLNCESCECDFFKNDVVEIFRKARPLLAHCLLLEQNRVEERFEQTVVRQIAGTADETEMLTLFMTAALHLLNENRACVLKPSGDHYLEVIATRGLKFLKLGERRAVHDFGTVRRALAPQAQNGVYHQYGPDDRATEVVRLTDTPMQSNFAIAIRFQGEVFGLLNIESERRLITERYRRAITRAADRVASVLRGLKAARLEILEIALSEVDVELHTTIGTLQLILQKHWRDIGQSDAVPGDLRARALRHAEKINRLLEAVRHAHSVPRTLSGPIASFDLLRALEPLSDTSDPNGLFGVRMTVSLPVAGVNVRGREDGCRQIVRNLILNTAQHATAADGHVEGFVTLRREDAPDVKGEAHWLLTYWDTGQAPPSLALEAGAGRGIPHIKRIAAHYGWHATYRVHPENGSLQWEFRIPQR